MPLRAIKHQLTCPFELTSGNSLIGGSGILVIPENHLVLLLTVILSFKVHGAILYEPIVEKASCLALKRLF